MYLYNTYKYNTYLYNTYLYNTYTQYNTQYTTLKNTFYIQIKVYQYVDNSSLFFHTVCFIVPDDIVLTFVLNNHFLHLLN
jgi:hypothetical protein